MATTPAPKIDLRTTITSGYAARHPPVACTFCGVVSQCDKNTFNINCRVGNAKVREYTIATYHLHWPRKKGDPCTAAYVRVIQAHKLQFEGIHDVDAYIRWVLIKDQDQDQPRSSWD